ncbi:MAG: bacillithiol biosynthesis cysteine-adding enzyme BshC [Planctomycetota bacterium]|nr:bacillithiol biosynthesis cysteine-adding enzyme BshC [Planctomycetota bacterium]
MSVIRVDRTSYAAAGFGGTLTHDLAHGVPSAQSFFPARRWQDVAAQIAARSYPRDEVCRVLGESAQRSGAPEAALASLRLLRDPNTYVVATGQQAGFLGGPLYTLHKALTAIKLARSLTAESGGRAHVVPVFWVAGDDHDLAEIDHAEFLVDDGTVRRVQAVFEPGSLGCSACDARLDSSPEKLQTLRAELRETLGADAVVERCLGLYAAHDLSEAFARLLYEWLGDLGLIVVQSSDVRALAGPVLLRELDDYDLTSRLIQEAALTLQKHGYKPGFSTQARVAPHFFIASEPGRIRAHLDPAGNGMFQERSAAFAARQQVPRAFSKQELAELIAARPQRFSAGAALRPVAQQYVFPVVAAVLGPGEIDYWAQLRTVHEHFGVPWPVIVPRATLTLLDAQAEKALRKLGLTAASPELFLDYEALRKKVLAHGELGGRLEERRARILAEIDAMAADVRAVDGGLQPLFDKARERIVHELERIADKTSASLGQRDGAGARRLRYLSSLVRPGNAPQERVLTTAFLLAKYATLPQDLLEVIDPSAREHMIVQLAVPLSPVGRG